MPTFDTPEPITATVEISSGAVRLTATERSDTVVEVRPRDHARSHDVKAAEQVRVDFHGGNLTVASRRGFSFARRGAVDVDIVLPAGSRLRAAVASAQVDADGDYGDCTFDSASGDLTIGTVTGNLKVNTASGDLAALALTGSAIVSTASGDTRIGDVEGDIAFRAASGSLRLGGLRGTVSAHTSSGEVGVATAVRGAISVHTRSGRVTAGIATGTSAKLELRTQSGTIYRDLEDVDGPLDADDTVTVQATTGSANISVAPALPPAG